MNLYYKVLTILFLNMMVHQAYGSYNKNHKYQSFNNSHNQDQSHIRFSRNSAFIRLQKTPEQKIQEQPFKAINEFYRQQVEKHDSSRIISSIISAATQKAQSMAMHNQEFSKNIIYLYCSREGFFINEPIINVYLEWTQNEPSNLEDVLKKAYKAGAKKK